MNTKRILLYGLHILKNHFLTTIIFIAFMYLYFSLFRGTISQLISGIVISILYLYGNFSSGRYHAKKRDALPLSAAILSIIIATIPSIVFAYLASINVSLNDKGLLKTHWLNVVYRLWNSPFIGIFSYADEVAKNMHSKSPIVISYWIVVAFLPVASFLGYAIGILEAKGKVKLPEYSLFPKKKGQNKKQGKTGKSY